MREELSIPVQSTPKKLPYVPSEDEVKRYYEAVWKEKNIQDMLIVKTLLYTGIRVSELVRLKTKDVDFDLCQLNIVNGKGKKDRKVPFPKGFREPLAFHVEKARQDGHSSLFESSWKKPYSDRGIRRKLEKYSKIAGIDHNITLPF